MKWMPGVGAALAVCAACSGGRADETRPGSERQRAQVETTYAIHVGGVCSTGFAGSGGGGTLGSWEGIVSIDAPVDQRSNMAEATADMREVLDSYCTGDNWCYVFTYSNGGAVISRTLSLFESDWNILWILNSASNEGGSEIGGTGWLGEIIGGCGLAGHVGPTDHRSGWNHNDTGGELMYMMGGRRCMAPWVQCLLLPGEDDGAVAFHSSGGMNDTYSADTLCVSSQARYAGHLVAFRCEGFGRDHYGMRTTGVCQTGGC